MLGQLGRGDVLEHLLVVRHCLRQQRLHLQGDRLVFFGGVWPVLLQARWLLILKIFVAADHSCLKIFALIDLLALVAGVCRLLRLSL